MGLAIAGIAPFPDIPAWLAGGWPDFFKYYGVTDWWQRWRGFIGWGIVILTLIGLRHSLFWPLKKLYILRLLFGRRIFGKARFAKVRDIDRDLTERKMFTPGGLLLGKLNGRDIYHHGEGHIFTIASAGGGKSSGLVVPALLTLTEGSVIVTDPSGELAMMTGRRRAEIGPVIYLNPYGRTFEQESGQTLRDDGFNPFSCLDPKSENFASDVQALARLLMVTDRKESGSYWNDEGAEILSLMIAAIVLYESPDLHNLAFLYQVVRAQPKDMKERLQYLAERPEVSISSEASKFLGMMNAEGQWQGVISKAALATKRYAPDQPLGVHTAKNGLDTTRLKKENLTVFILIPSSMIAVSMPWLNLVMGILGHAIGRPGPARQVTMLIDEAPALGYMPDLQSFMSQFRKAGLRVWLFSQTYSAMASPDRYGEAGMKELMGLAAIKQFFSVGEPELHLKISQWAGTRTRANPSSTGAISDVALPLLRPDEVRGLKKWNQIIIIEGFMFPILAKLVPYFKRPELLKMADKNPYRV